MTDKASRPEDRGPKEDGIRISESCKTHVPIEVATQLTALQPRLYGFILKRLASHEQAADLVQKINLVICENAARYTPGSNFSAWAFTIARFQLLAWRKSNVRNRLIFTDSLHEAMDAATDTETAQHDDRVIALRDCLAKLKQDDLTLIQRRYRDATPMAVLAGIQKKSVDAIGMRLSRARRQLAECIQAKLRTQSIHD